MLLGCNCGLDVCVCYFKLIFYGEPFLHNTCVTNVIDTLKNIAKCSKKSNFKIQKKKTNRIFFFKKNSITFLSIHKALIFNFDNAQ